MAFIDVLLKDLEEEKIFKSLSVNDIEDSDGLRNAFDLPITEKYIFYIGDDLLEGTIREHLEKFKDSEQCSSIPLVIGYRKKEITISDIDASGVALVVPPKKTSSVDDSFTVSGDGRFRACNLCEKIYSISTSKDHRKRHLLVKHGINLEEVIGLQKMEIKKNTRGRDEENVEKIPSWAMKLKEDVNRVEEKQEKMLELLELVLKMLRKGE